MKRRRLFLSFFFGVAALAPAGASHYYWVEYSNFLWIDNDHCLVCINEYCDGVGGMPDGRVVLLNVRTKAVCPVTGFEDVFYTLVDDRIFLNSGKEIALLKLDGRFGPEIECLYQDADPSTVSRIADASCMYDSILEMRFPYRGGNRGERIIYDAARKKILDVRSYIKEAWGRPPRSRFQLSGYPFAGFDIEKRFVQVSINRVRENAFRTVGVLTEKGITAHVLRKGEFFFLWAGPFDDEKTAERTLETIRAMGHGDAFVLTETFYLDPERRPGFALSESNMWTVSGDAYTPLFDDFDGVFPVDAVGGRIHFLREGALLCLNLQTGREEAQALQFKESGSGNPILISASLLADVRNRRAGRFTNEEINTLVADYRKKHGAEKIANLVLSVPNKVGEKLVIRFRRKDDHWAVLNSVSLGTIRGKETLLLPPIAEPGP